MEDGYNPIKPNIASVYSIAFSILAKTQRKPFDIIKEMFLSGLDDDPYFDVLQKAAIRLAAEKINSREGGPLYGILTVTWEEIGLSSDNVDALDIAQREGILNGIMTVCKSIITDHADYLTNVAAVDTSLDVDWYEQLNPGQEE